MIKKFCKFSISKNIFTLDNEIENMQPSKKLEYVLKKLFLALLEFSANFVNLYLVFH